MTTIELGNGLVVHLGRPAMVLTETVRNPVKSLHSTDGANFDSSANIECEDEPEKQDLEDPIPEDSI